MNINISSTGQNEEFLDRIFGTSGVAPHGRPSRRDSYSSENSEMIKGLDSNITSGEEDSNANVPRGDHDQA